MAIAAPSPSAASLGRLIDDLEADSDRLGGWAAELRAALAARRTVVIVGVDERTSMTARRVAHRLASTIDPRRAHLVAPTSVRAAHEHLADEASDLAAVVVLSPDGDDDDALALLDAARRRGTRFLALTGRWPNPLAAWADDSFCVASTDRATTHRLLDLAAGLVAPIA